MQTTGSKQMIPFTPQTSRMEWLDLWGRRWAQPVRSLFIDAAPIPGPLRNFQMTSTFEVVNPSTGARVMHWQSDQNMLVRVHVKLLNNYQKWFEITDCAANQVFSLLWPLVASKKVKRRLGTHDWLRPLL